MNVINSNDQNNLHNPLVQNQNQNPNYGELNSYYKINNPAFEPSIFSSSSQNQIVRVLPPNERINKSDYSYVKCKNITTYWINGFGFSFLTNILLDPVHFFLLLTGKGFNISTWNENLTRNKVSRDKMEEFINQVNRESNIEVNIVKGKKHIFLKRFITLLFFFISLVLLIVSLILVIQNEKKAKPDETTKFVNVFLLPIAIVSMTMFLPIFILYMQRRRKEFEITKNIITISGMDNLINNWNTQYFIQNGLYVIVPRNLIYLHFVLDTNLKVTLQNHCFPDDIEIPCISI